MLTDARKPALATSLPHKADGSGMQASQYINTHGESFLGDCCEDDWSFIPSVAADTGKPD